MPYLLIRTDLNTIDEKSETSQTPRVDQTELEVTNDIYNSVDINDWFFANNYHVEARHLHFKDGVFREKTADEVMIDIRRLRIDLLSGSDWTVLPDSPLTDAKKAEWQTYRQQLRDLPTSNTNPFDIDFPVKPS